jgi:hypothetical protein
VLTAVARQPKRQWRTVSIRPDRLKHDDVASEADLTTLDDRRADKYWYLVLASRSSVSQPATRLKMWCTPRLAVEQREPIATGAASPTFANLLSVVSTWSDRIGFLFAEPRNQQPAETMSHRRCSAHRSTPAPGCADLAQAASRAQRDSGRLISGTVAAH